MVLTIHKKITFTTQRLIHVTQGARQKICTNQRTYSLSDNRAENVKVRIEFE